MDTTPQQNPLNPFLSIWVKPRATIRQIVDSDPYHYVIPIALVTGIYQAFDQAADQTSGDHFTLIGILLLAFLLGPLRGLLSIYIGGLLFTWSGSWFGGTADYIQVRAALAWSSVPEIVHLLLLSPYIIVYGRDWFSSSPFDVNEIGLLFLIVTSTVIFIWKGILAIICLAEVHQFSLWRSLATIICGYLIIIAPFLLLFALLGI
ncbi:MAG TPA: Yip1 family protein [Anaerolineae bacterium]|nr:Yip1 family protein [Anaerolineae bacterium]